jgi:protein-disulfide isomerase
VASHLLSWKTLDRIGTALVVVVGSAVVWSMARPYVAAWISQRKISKEPISIEQSAVLGSSSAKVGMVIFSCFECPASSRFAREVWPSVKKSLVEPGRLIVAFNTLPLPIHKNALRAAQSAECSRQQNLFWPVHDRFFSGEVSLDRAGMLDELTKLGLDMDKFSDCVSGPVTARISAQEVVAASIGVQKTPAFAIGAVLPDRRIRPDKLLQGFTTVDAIKSAVESIR